MPVMRRRDRATPRARSMSGTAQSPRSLVVLAAQRGSSSPSAWSRSASATAWTRGVRSICPRSSRPAAMAGPSVNWATASTAKKTTARPRPVSPKANRQSGMPMLPVLGKISAGR